MSGMVSWTNPAHNERTPRPDTPPTNAISTNSLMSLSDRCGIILTWVIYVANAATLNNAFKLNCKVKINRMSTHDEQERCKGQLECTHDPSGLTFSHTHGYLEYRDCGEESRVTEAI
ncbi:hypothetical protein BDR06DRAFT_957969 [Suillus hirtellus]|nr:hypothetical protein BDR06DRAFT_957969 [Suillus hirtellus]